MVGKENEFVVVTAKSDYGSRNRKEFLLLGCERGGKYVQYKPTMKRPTGTRKCACLFKLRANPYKSDGLWRVKVVCGVHNHARAESLLGHAYAGRLTQEEVSVIHDMVDNMVKPSYVLLSLKERRPENLSIIQQIYNASGRYKKTKRGDYTEMQHLMSLLERDIYVLWHRVNQEINVVQDMFWSHPGAIKLFNLFPTVVLLDSTYKTNRYGIPLLEMVGVTSTDITFTIGFAYMSSEKLFNVVWALRKLRGLVTKEDNLPTIVVTDRDLALIAAVADVFPKTKHMLCTSHIAKNVSAKCKMFCQPRTVWEAIMESWGDLVDSRTEKEYTSHLKAFEVTCDEFSRFVNYVTKYWLNDHKERFVSCWIDVVMHMGNTTTNKVEGAHSRLKHLLKNSKGDLCACWDTMAKLTILQHTRILSSFQHSLFIKDHKFKKHMYKNLCGFVSKKALQLICTEYSRVKRVGVDKRACGCLMRITHGIPCACELARYTCVPLQSVHDIWKRLSWATVEVKDEEPSVELNLKSQFEALKHKFEEAKIPIKRALKEKLRELAFPDSTSMCPPHEKVKTKSRPKGQPIGSTKRDPSYHEYVDNFVNSLNDNNSTMACTTRPTAPVPKWSSPKECNATKPRRGRGRPKKTEQKAEQGHQHNLIREMPVIFQPHIDYVLNVEGDGNCGHKAIAALLGMREHVWHEIRNMMIDELTTRAPTYANMHGPARSQIILDALTLPPKEIACPEKCLSIPDMGYIVATAFSVVFITLAKTGCSTYLPLAGAPPKKHQIICLGHVYGNHWIQVFLKNDHLMPQTAPQWIYHCNPEAVGWETRTMSAWNNSENNWKINTEIHLLF